MSPISFSDAAVAHIQSMLEKNEKALGFRLAIKKTGCSGYAYVPSLIETINEKDVHFEAQNGLQVYIDPECVTLLKVVYVDYLCEEGHGLKQKRLVFTNPNEKGRCGCGESFTIE